MAFGLGPVLIAAACALACFCTGVESAVCSLIRQLPQHLLCRPFRTCARRPQRQTIHVTLSFVVCISIAAFARGGWYASCRSEGICTTSTLRTRRRRGVVSLRAKAIEKALSEGSRLSALRDPRSQRRWLA